MENNEYTEETSKAKSTPQFNARISDELKKTIHEIGSHTGKSKHDLLAEFVRIYQAKRADDEFADIDLSRYDNLSSPLKESVHNAFMHILNAVNGNLSVLKQEAVLIEGKKKDIKEKESAYKIEIEAVKSTCNGEILSLKEKNEEMVLELRSKIQFLEKESSELQSKNRELSKEFYNVNKISEQVQVVTDENKELRESNRTAVELHKATENNLLSQIKTLSEELTETKKTIFKVEIENDSKDKTIKALEAQLSLEKNERIDEKDTYKEELLSISKEFSDLKNQYNKVLGKLEVLEKD